MIAHGDRSGCRLQLKDMYTYCYQPSIHNPRESVPHATAFHKSRHLMAYFCRHLRFQTALRQRLRLIKIDMAQQIFNASHGTTVHRQMAKTRPIRMATHIGSPAISPHNRKSIPLLRLPAQSSPAHVTYPDAGCHKCWPPAYCYDRQPECTG